MLSNKNHAIIVIEFQKTWSQSSFFYRLIRQQYESRNVYTNTKELLNFARQNKVDIIQSPFILDKSNKEQYKKIPLPPKLFRQFTANTWRAEYTDGIFDPSDIEVKGRTAFDNTVDSNLRDILKERQIKTLYFAGFTTDHCVAETMTTLSSEGYKCVLISDCSAARTSKLQTKIENKFSSITSKKLIEKLKESID